MKKLSSYRAWSLLIPFLLALAAGLTIQYRQADNPVYAFQFRADLGSMIIIVGAATSGILLIVRLVRRSVTRQLQRAVRAVEEDAAQSRRRFLSRLDHELKNPLTALRMELAFLAERQTPDDEIDKVVRDMSTQTERLSQLISDLRKLAQLEEMAIERQPVSIEEVLSEIVETAQDHPNYAERKIHLTLLRGPWPLPEVFGDRGLLWLACFNLLDNALKFTQPGTEIEVRGFEANSRVVVEVADNGPGIPEDDLPHIFEELYRGTNAHGFPGSGLGLSLVRAVVSLHQGTVTVRSRAGQGTVFTLQLPIE